MNPIEFFQEIKIYSTILHVVSIVFGMGGALVSDILFSFYSKDKKLNETELSTLSILKVIVHYSLILIILSGIFIFLSDIQKYVHSTKFLSKMSILCILLINGYVLNKYIWPHLLNKNFFTLKKERTIRKIAFVCGSISVTSWLLLCILGVIHNISYSYTLIISTYLFIILSGALVSLLIEKRELN